MIAPLEASGSGSERIDKMDYVMNQQHEAFLRRLQHSDIEDILGVVSAGGVGGVERHDGWHLVLYFDGWRRPHLPLRPGELRVEMAVSEDELSSRMAQINPYDILHVRARVAEHPAGGTRARAEEIVSTTVSDAELEAHARELQKPVLHTDPCLGTFTLDRAVNWFCGDLLWSGQEVRLNLSMDGCDSIAQPLAIAAELWRPEADWNARIMAYAVENLLPLKNDVWLEEDEAELDTADFEGRMSLQTITVYADGSFEFWFDDGDLFWGHVIMVRGSLAGGLCDAGIHG